MGLVYSPLLFRIVTLRTFVSSEGWTCSTIANFQLPLGWLVSISITKSPSANWCCSSCHLLVFLGSSLAYSRLEVPDGDQTFQLITKRNELQTFFKEEYVTLIFERITQTYRCKSKTQIEICTIFLALAIALTVRKMKSLIH